MIKFISFIILVLIVNSNLSAKEKRWNLNNLKTETKIIKIAEQYSMTIVEKDENEGGTRKLYKSQDGKNWIYLWKRGSKENFETTYFYALACLDGIYDSYMQYGECTIPNAPYIYATITEKSTSITNDGVQAEDMEYTWTNPRALFLTMFRGRVICFKELTADFKDDNIQIPENIKNRYAYFDKWLAENDGYENSADMLMKEYRNYLKSEK